MLWLGPHLYEKGSFYAHTLPAIEGGIHWRGGGEGIIFGTDPVGVGHGRNWATSSPEGLDIFYVHITWNKFVDWVRIYMNINAYMIIYATKPVFRVSDKIIPKTSILSHRD